MIDSADVRAAARARPAAAPGGGRAPVGPAPRSAAQRPRDLARGASPASARRGRLTGARGPRRAHGPGGPSGPPGPTGASDRSGKCRCGQRPPSYPSKVGLLEREPELARLRRAMRASARSGRVVAVTGEAGAGKTSLLRAATATPGGDARRARALRPARDAASAGSGPRRAGGARRDRAGRLPASPARGDVEALVVSVVSREPTTVVVEDVQWIDEASVEALRLPRAPHRRPSRPARAHLPRRGDRHGSPAAPAARRPGSAGELGGRRPRPAQRRGRGHTAPTAPASTRRASTGSPGETPSTSARSVATRVAGCPRRCATPCWPAPTG